MQPLVTGLTEYGLSEKEAKIYLLCLEYGTIQASKVATLSGIHRTTCYDLLNGLVHKGVLVETQQQGTKKYSAVDPELLFRQLQERFGAFQSIIPELVTLGQKYNIKPKIKIYEGLAGVKQVYMDTLSSKTDILAFVGNQAASNEILKWFRTEYLQARLQKKIYAKVVLCESAENHDYHSHDKDYYRESRFLKDDVIEFGCELGFYGPNKMMIALYNESDMCGVIIESEYLYKTLCGIFSYIWTGLGK